MEMFTERGNTFREVIDQIRLKYGDKATILSHRDIRYGGFLGFFEKKGCEVSGYLSNKSAIKRKNIVEESAPKKELDPKHYENLLSEIKSLKNIVQAESYKPKRHSNLEEIEQILLENELTESYIEPLLNRLERELSLEDLRNMQVVQDTVVEWIGESIKIYTGIPKEKPQILILVGPTGVGKTTTVAKLAAVHKLGRLGVRPKDVRIITIDNYRIGAKQQIEAYGDIMQIPVHAVETYNDLKKKLSLFSSADLILIDTIGKSPNDSSELAEMKEILDACSGNAELFLTVSATTKYLDLQDIIKQYEPFRYSSVIVTKLDETMRSGNIISALANANKSIAYLTDGQSVPDNIERATVGKLLNRFKGIKINKSRINRIFSDNIVKKGPISQLEENALKEGWENND